MGGQGLFLGTASIPSAAAAQAPRPARSRGHARWSALFMILLVAVALSPVAANAKARIVGHRGGGVGFPENTLANFTHSMSVGIDFIETDGWLSSDGVVILHHDLDLCRTTNIGDFPGFDCSPGGQANNPLGRYPWVHDFTAAELKALDAGSWFDPSFAGEQLPTLAEALTLLNGSNTILMVELKVHGMGTIMEQTVNGLGFGTDNLWIWARTEQRIDEFAAAYPDPHRVFGALDPTALVPADLQRLAGNGLTGVTLLHLGLTQAAINLVHSHGMLAFPVVTAGPGYDREQYIAWGADMILVLYNRSIQVWFDIVAALPCVDGIDNDGDGAIDFDGLDVDFDFVLDFQADGGCASRTDLSEVGEAPNPPPAVPALSRGGSVALALLLTLGLALLQRRPEDVAH